MKTIPMLFNDEMVRRILDGTKYQTRRPMKRATERARHRTIVAATEHMMPRRISRYAPTQPGLPADRRETLAVFARRPSKQNSKIAT